MFDSVRIVRIQAYFKYQWNTDLDFNRLVIIKHTLLCLVVVIVSDIVVYILDSTSSNKPTAVVMTQLQQVQNTVNGNNSTSYAQMPLQSNVCEVTAELKSSSNSSLNRKFNANMIVPSKSELLR